MVDVITNSSLFFYVSPHVNILACQKNSNSTCSTLNQHISQNLIGSFLNITFVLNVCVCVAANCVSISLYVHISTHESACVFMLWFVFRTCVYVC